MTIMNALFYLLLLLGGLAVALILADLNRAEQAALQALARFDAEAARTCPPVRLDTAACPVGRPAHQATLRPVQAPACITLSGFSGPAAEIGPADTAARPSYDFALAAGVRPALPAATAKKGQAVAGLPAAGDSQDWNCCA